VQNRQGINLVFKKWIKETHYGSRAIKTNTG
jgi:hypothetical protein